MPDGHMKWECARYRGGQNLVEEERHLLEALEEARDVVGELSTDAWVEQSIPEDFFSSDLRPMTWAHRSYLTRHDELKRLTGGRCA